MLIMGTMGKEEYFNLFFFLTKECLIWWWDGEPGEIDVPMKQLSSASAK